MNPNGTVKHGGRVDGRLDLRKPEFLRDMLLSLLFAVLTGVVGGLLLILVVFGCTSARADMETPIQGNLRLHAMEERSLRQAPLQRSDLDSHHRQTGVVGIQ